MLKLAVIAAFPVLFVTLFALMALGVIPEPSRGLVPVMGW